MSLSNWEKNRWIEPHTTSPEEIGNLLAVAERDISDCQTEGLSEDWRFNIAYNAALQLATAALAAAGYRAERQQHHYRVIHSLEHTIGLDSDTVHLFDAFRKKRNQAGYDVAGMISEQEAGEMLTLARRLRSEVEEWLRDHHSNLI